VVAVSAILLGLAIFAGIIALAIPGAVIAAVIYKTATPAVWALLIILAAVALIGFVVWLALRLSLAAPMSFEQGEFRLFESWPATRERVWTLFGVGLVAFGCLILMEMAFAVIIGVILVAGFAVALAGHVSPGALQLVGKASDPAAMMGLLWPLFAVIVPLSCLFTGAGSAIVVAPFVRAYQILAPSIDHTQPVAGA
jgi:hypothetical protein